MDLLKRGLRTLFARAEALFDFAFGQRLNPFNWLGALGWYFYWIVAGTGIYLYIFFDTGITNAYESVQYITHDQWYLAGVTRSLHRYASDALVIIVCLHLLREFSLDRLRGRRFFAWLTGVPALFFIYICGITGYWLVWDQLAQYIAIATSEWLDTLPLFGQPIAANFLNATTLADRFFPLMVFIHIFASPLLAVIPGGQLWLLLFGGLLLTALLPWIPPLKPAPAAVVSLENCNGCARCFDDCPYGAIRMAPRSDGKNYDAQADVDPDQCMSCGLCVGSCPTATPFRRAGPIVPGIELPGYPVAAMRESTIAAASGFVRGRRILVYACSHSRAEMLQNDNVRVITLPCVPALPPAFIDFALSRNLADGVAISGCADGDCYFRLGGAWMQQRIDGKRDPFLRKRVDRERLRFWQYRAGDPARQSALDDFAQALRRMPRNHPGMGPGDE